LSKPQSVTSVGQSPDEERRERMIKYLISQIVRVVCIILAVFVQGWMMWVFFAGAIFLPYFAVVLANAQGQGRTTTKATAVVAPTLKISADAFTSTVKPEDK
jgi:bacteriorhodopsin